MVRMDITNHYHNDEPIIDSNGIAWRNLMASDEMTIQLNGPREEVKAIAVALKEMPNIELGQMNAKVF